MPDGHLTFRQLTMTNAARVLWGCIGIFRSCICLQRDLGAGLFVFIMIIDVMSLAGSNL